MKENYIMKILIVSTYFPPKTSIASLRPYSFAKRWSQLGHDVTVLTAPRYDFEPSLDLDCSSFNVISVPLPKLHGSLVKKLRKGKKDNASVARKNNTPKSSGKIFSLFEKFRDETGILKDQRMPSHLDPWYFKAYPIVSNEKWDLVVTTFSPYVSHLVGYRLKKKGKARFWIADYRDLWTGSHMFCGMWPFSLIEKYMERRFNRLADQITTVSEPLADYLKENYKTQKVAVIENGFDRDDLKGLDPESIFVENKVNIVYTGNIYPKFRDPSPLFEAVNRIKHSEKSALLANLEIIFVGNNEKAVIELAKKHKINEYVNCQGMVARKDALRMQRDAHALLFLESDNVNAKGVLTGKLFEYINSGTQIWGVGVTEKSSSGRLIHDSGCGILFGTNVEKLEKNLVNLLAERVKYKISPNSKVIDKFDRRSLADKMLALIKNVPN